MPTWFINVKEKGAKKAEKNILGLNKSLGGLASKAALAAGAFFGTGMLLSGMKSAIDLAGKQEAAEKALETALGRTSDALLNQASALQQASIFGDEAIIQQQAFLGSLKFSEEQIKSIIPVAMDLAAATGMTLESAVRNTAKTFSGLAGELGELVPQLRGLTKEQMMAGEAVKVMGDLFGGQALSQTETMTGKLEQMKNATGDAMEAGGGLASKAVIPLANALKTAAESATTFINSISEEDKIIKENTLTANRNAAAFNAIGNAIGFLTDKMASFAEKSSPFRANLKEIRDTGESVELSLQEQAMALDLVGEKQIKGGANFDNQIKKQKEVNFTIKDQIELDELRRDQSIKFTSDLVGNLGDLAGAFSKGKKVEARLAQTQAVIDTYAGANKALASAAPPFNFISAAAVIAGGLANVAKISSSIGDFKAAATGMNEVVNKPTLILAGEAGAESVNITPLTASQSQSATSGSVTVNVSGNVMSPDYVEDVLADQIKEAVRKGVSFA